MTDCHATSTFHSPSLPSSFTTLLSYATAQSRLFRASSSWCVFFILCLDLTFSICSDEYSLKTIDNAPVCVPECIQLSAFVCPPVCVCSPHYRLSSRGSRHTTKSAVKPKKSATNQPISSAQRLASRVCVTCNAFQSRFNFVPIVVVQEVLPPT